MRWSLDDSLKKLGLDYVDCFLIHWPIAVERTEDRQPRKGADGKVSDALYCHLETGADFVIVCHQ
jgi:diketogulonate reductase-like aldo/keto reductase